MADDGDLKGNIMGNRSGSLSGGGRLGIIKPVVTSTTSQDRRSVPIPGAGSTSGRSAAELAREIQRYLGRPAVVDPRVSPRYIDNLFEAVSYSLLNGTSILHWNEGGHDHRAEALLSELEQNDSAQFIAIFDVHPRKEDALKTVAQYSALMAGARFYSFYRIYGDVIMPTCFSLHSTPEFHRLWPSIKERMRARAIEIVDGMTIIGNTSNRIPFVRIDNSGNVVLSGDPTDLMNLMRLRRASRLRGKRVRHSGQGVRYTVIGPHDKLKGTSVYVLKDAQGNVLYVGKGDTLARLRAHISDPKKTQWFGEIAEVEVKATGLNNTQALALEEDLIGHLKPFHNVDRTPFRSVFGDAMEVGPNLPRAQQPFKFRVEWGN